MQIEAPSPEAQLSPVKHSPRGTYLYMSHTVRIGDILRRDVSGIARGRDREVRDEREVDCRNSCAVKRQEDVRRANSAPVRVS